MRKILALMLAGFLISPSANAGGLDFGGSFGIATGGQDAESFNNQLRDLGLNIPENQGATTSGDIRATWQAYITYQFLPRWGVELAYVDLGEATVDFSGIDEPIDVIFDAIGDIHPRSAQGVKVSATYRFPLNNSLQLQTKLGIFNWKTDYFFNGVTPDNVLVSRTLSLSGTDITFGMGLAHKLTNEITAHLDWDFYSIDNEVINTFTFGASYLFE